METAKAGADKRGLLSGRKKQQATQVTFGSVGVQLFEITRQGKVRGAAPPAFPAAAGSVVRLSTRCALPLLDRSRSRPSAPSRTPPCYTGPSA